MQKNDRDQTGQNKHGDRQSDKDGGNHTPPTEKPADLSPKSTVPPAKPQQKR